MSLTEERFPDLVDDPELVEVKVQNDNDYINNGRVAGFCRRCLLRFDSITTSKNPLPEKPTMCQRIRYAFLCPPHGVVATYITTLFSFGLLYCFLWSVFEHYALPPNPIFEIWIHFITSIVGGYIVHLFGLPPLLGMLLMGTIVHFLPHKSISSAFSFVLRNTALTVILIRAGLGLDPTALKKLSFVVIRLAFMPCLMEAITMGISSHLFLDLPIIWGLILGFTIAAVSPAIVMPCLLHLQDLGYGVDKGIPTLLIAAASIDDVLAITGFGILIGIAFSEGNIVLAFFKGPLEALLGILLGTFFGVMLWYIPGLKHDNRVFLKGFILFSVGLMGILGCPRLEIPGTGPLLCLTTAFVAAAGWRQRKEHQCLKQITASMSILWFIFQPLLFGLIGAQMDIHKISARSISNGIATLTISLCIRSCVAFCAVFGTNLVFKEKFFVAMAWIPKATVQAAIGSLALSTAQENNKPVFEEYGQIILDVAILAILITAPLGAVLVVFTGPRLLKKTDPKTLVCQKVQLDEQRNTEEENTELPVPS